MNDNVIDMDEYREKKFFASIKPEQMYDEELLKIAYEAYKERHKAEREQNETI